MKPFFFFSFFAFLLMFIKVFCALIEIDPIKCLLGFASMNFMFVHSQGSSCAESFIAEVTGDDDSFEMVCFNVIF